MFVLPTKPQWKKWSLIAKTGYLGFWLSIAGLSLAVLQITFPIISYLYIPYDPEMREFDQLIYHVNEEVHKPHDAWIKPYPAAAVDCNEGSRIATKALESAEKIQAFDTDRLLFYRETKAMAKHEYLAMLHAWVSDVRQVCRQELKLDKEEILSPARRSLSEYEIVTSLKEELFNKKISGSDLPRLQEIANDVENITTWYAGQSASILFLNGQYEYSAAHKLAQKSHDLYPNEPSYWIDSVLNTKEDGSPSDK